MRAGRLRARKLVKKYNEYLRCGSVRMVYHLVELLPRPINLFDIDATLLAAFMNFEMSFVGSKRVDHSSVPLLQYGNAPPAKTSYSKHSSFFRDIFKVELRRAYNAAHLCILDFLSRCHGPSIVGRCGSSAVSSALPHNLLHSGGFLTRL